MLITIISKTAVIFIIAAIGAAARLRKIVSEGSIQDLCKVVLFVTLPFLYFTTLSLQCTPDMMREIWNLPLFAMLFVMIAYVAGLALSRFLPLSPEARATFTYLITFTNCGFLAIPIAHVLFGEQGVLRVVFFNIGFNLLYWTIGVSMLRRSGGEKVNLMENLANSGTIGLLLGFIVGITAMKLPGFFIDTTRLIGSATIPLALLMIGALVTDYRGAVPQGYKRALTIIVLMRLIVLPVIAVVIMKWCVFLPELSRAVIVLQCAMPSASTTPIFVKRFGGDMRLAGLGVFATTALSIITIPLIMALL